MLSKRIEGTNVVLAKDQPEYLQLAARYTVDERGVPQWETAWEPTPGELSKMNAGAHVILRILGMPPAALCDCRWGVQHPPVNVSVGEPPEIVSLPLEPGDLEA